jgi:DNA-binding MarR family transcriptional regulator
MQRRKIDPKKDLSIEGELGILLRKLLLKMKDQAHKHRQHKENLEVNETQGRIIWIIAQHYKSHQEKLIQKDLEKFASLRGATITGILQTLEQKEIIKREVDPSDERKKFILLTDKAQDIIKSFEEVFNKGVQKMFKGFRRVDVVILKKYLMRAIKNLSEDDKPLESCDESSKKGKGED